MPAPKKPDFAPAAWRDEPMTRVLEFARGFGPAHAALAMHAAVPLGLTPELLHVIRLNLVRFAPWIAEADLLLSRVCQDVGGGFYQMDAEVRELLLEELRSDPAFGEGRLLEVAELMLAYVARSLRGTRDAEARSFLLVQEWTALAYLQPALAARSIAAALKDGLSANRGADALRVASLAQALAAPLHAEEEVLLYAAGVEKLVTGQISLGVRFLEALGPADQRHEVHGVPLPSADEWRRSVEKRQPTSGRGSGASSTPATEAPPGAWEFYVLEDGKTIKEGVFRGTLEIGRQQGLGIEAEAFLSHFTPQENLTRLIVAHNNESGISRRAVDIESLPDGNAEVTNLSVYNPVELESGTMTRSLPAEESICLPPPITITFRGHDTKRLVRVQPAGMPKPNLALSSGGDSGLCFTLYIPKTMRPRKRYTALVFVHTEDYTTALMDTSMFDKEARDRLGANYETNYQWTTEDTKKLGAANIDDVRELTLTPDLVGIECDPPQRTIQYAAGATSIAEYRLRTTETSEKELLQRLEIYHQGLILAEFRVSIRVGVTGPVKINVSYRLRDVPHHAERLIDLLVARFGVGAVANVDSAKESIENCDVLVVVIGNQWQEGNPIAEPQDHVRLDIRRALEHGATIIPVLMDDVRMPPPNELPPDVRDLTFYNARTLRADPDFDRDAERVIQAIEMVAPKPAVAAAAKQHRKIYACYTHKDRDIVLQFEQFAKTLGDEYLRDMTSLRAGEAWDEQFKRVIDEADLFQLFWSKNAAASKYVRAEVEYALSLKRDNFIRPVYWEEPLFTEGMPVELQRGHFQRIAPPTASQPEEPPPAAPEEKAASLRVFVSGTQRDLGPCRERVRVALLKMGHVNVELEGWAETKETLLTLGKQKLAQCDVYVGIFAWRYGWIPPGEDRSITELEYREARRLGIPTLIFLLDEAAPWQPEHIDTDPSRIKALRSELRSAHVVATFSTPDDLALTVMQSLHNLKSTPRAPRVFISCSTRDSEFVEREIGAPLRNHGVRLLFAEETIGSADWGGEVLKGLESTDWLLVAMSPASVASQWVKTEVQFAFDRKIRILPVMIQDCDPSELHLLLSTTHRLDFRKPGITDRRALLKVFSIESREVEPDPELSREALEANGRAEVLKALERYDEALNAYDATIAAHPQDVVAKNGRAEAAPKFSKPWSVMTRPSTLTMPPSLPIPKMSWRKTAAPKCSKP
ncbi:MAG: TIR domain-containing protein [Planctomycetes bacterium]|nr:TIR domain-containing protein [Planctomycetota bacterium]